MATLGQGPLGTDLAVLDTSVLFPAALRDVLLLSAERRLYEPHWTDDILDELRRNLIRDRHLVDDKIDRMISEMRRAFPDALVRGHRELMPTMRNDPDDRHVLAAAVMAGARTIVTANLRHFQRSALEPHGVVARSPDEFLTTFAEEVPGVMRDIIAERARNLKSPPRSVEEVVTELGWQVPEFVAALGIDRL